MTAYELEPVYKRHDLLIELGRLEMAMEHLESRDEQQRAVVGPRLAQRMVRVRHEIEQLAA
jgi:hypothetical protein